MKGDIVMDCKISDSAAMKMKEILSEEEDKQLKFRLFVAHAHGDHAHYGLGLDYPKETDELVTADNGVEVLLEKGQDFFRFSLGVTEIIVEGAVKISRIGG